LLINPCIWKCFDPLRLIVRVSIYSALFFVAITSHAAPGMDSRPNNLTCLAPARPNIGSVILGQPFPDLASGSSLTVEFPLNNSSYLYLMHRDGRIFRFLNDAASSSRTVVADLRPLFAGTTPEGQSGLMDIAFHPDFSSNGQLYVAYTVPGAGRTSYVARYTSSDGGASFSQNAEILLSLPQSGTFHGVGTLFFGTDDYLYISFGDGGNSDLSQDPFEWYGKILRIDVDSGSPYGIPADNPYASGGGAAEVFAMGLRNPWRVSQDKVNGRIWAGDVGASDWEEVNEIIKGNNYGWPIREGAHCRTNGCDATGLVDPVYEYSHDNGCAVIGGHVYRGSAIPSMIGKYVFSDVCTGEISALDDSGQTAIVDSLLPSGLNIRDFSESPSGELYIITGSDNRLLQLMPDNSGGGNPGGAFPGKLSETGCFDPADPTQVTSGVIPYDINTALWSDGAGKRRWMALPDGEQISVQPDGDWEFPVGTVLIKEFSWNNSPFETRLFVRHSDGGWAGYTYEWNDSLTDADLVSPAGLVKQIDGQLNWMYPSQAQCLQCHSSAAGRTLGPETAQLNRLFLYPSGITSNQLETLESIGMFSNGLGGTPDVLPAMAAIDDLSQPVDERSRSYLHANCSNCHRPGGPGQGPMDFRYQTAFEDTNTCNIAPENGNLGVIGAMILSPGSSAIACIRRTTIECRQLAHKLLTATEPPRSMRGSMA